MTNTYDEYADKAAASYLQGRMDEQGAWVEAVRGQRYRYQLAEQSAWARWNRHYHANERRGTDDANRAIRRWKLQRVALDALLRRMGAE